MIVGIDLGTSTSEVSVHRNGKPVLIREVRHSTAGILPSVVGIDRRGCVCVGAPAASLLIPKPEFAVEEVKRLMGTEERVTIGGEEYRPQEISAFILRHLKEEAERFLGEPVTDAVITVPAFWKDAARQATEDAGELAGLRVRRIINEPTAAALAYGVERPGVEEKILVYDLGGGTLDVTVLELSEGILDVMASVGNPHLGGKEFDERLMRHLADGCRRQTGIDLTADARYRTKLKDAARRAKEALSSSDVTTVLLENLALTADGASVDFEHDLTRSTFEGLIRDLVESTREQIDAALAAKGVERSAIDTILMVGGSTRIPLVRQVVSHHFGGKALRTDISPDEAVSLGAAVLAGVLAGDSEVIITDVSPFTLGVATVEEDEDGRLTPGVFDPLIEKQSTIPRTVRRSYSTTVDWQESVHVRVFQGDARMCRDNTPVGDFRHRITPAPAGASIEVSITYNLNGRAIVTARDPRSGHETTAEMAAVPERMSGEQREAGRRRLESRWAQTGAGAATPTLAQPPEASAAPLSTTSRAPAEALDWRARPLYEPIAPLATHAERRLPTLPDEARDRVRDLLRALREAVLAGDTARVAAAERRLTDVLFDLD